MFDPNLPQEGTPLDAVQMRSQLNGLKAIMDAILTLTAAQVDGTNTLPPGSPANASVAVVGNTLHFTFELPEGQEGPMGQQGPPFANAVVDAVNTVAPGTPAAVGVSFDGTNVRFTFDIPRGSDGMNGSDGAQGPAGNDGSEGAQGQPGNDGPQGPPFAQAVVDAVNTLDPGQSAAVGVSFDGTNVRFTFGIPRGNDGAPGEVSQAQLDSAISGTSSNTNSVSTLDSPFADPDMEALRQKLNEVILNGRR
jgi:collagen type I alpha